MSICASRSCTWSFNLISITAGLYPRLIIQASLRATTAKRPPPHSSLLRPRSLLLSPFLMPSVSLYLPLSAPISLYLHLSLSLHRFLSFSLSLSLSLSISLSLSLHVSLPLPLYLSLSLSTCPYLSPCHSVCRPLSLLFPSLLYLYQCPSLSLYSILLCELAISQSVSVLSRAVIHGLSH